MSEPLTQAERAELVAEVTRQHEQSAFARKHMDLTDNSLLRYEATVAALTAENARLRETLTLGLGEQESVIAGLRAENEQLRSAVTEWTGMSGAVEIAISDLTNQSPWTALDVLRKARTFGDRARAALPSSRETTDG